MKRQGSTELPRFAVGALAVAGASAANGATVQISFTNNVVSSATGTTNFMADLTGDSVDDVGSRGAVLSSFAYVSGVAMAGRTALGAKNYVQFGVLDRAFTATANLLSRRRLVPVTFNDDQIGVGTRSGFLDASATAVGSLYEVQIHRLIFDDASATAPSGVAYEDPAYPAWQVSAVPEPGSNLALLALGAGGLTLRRRLKRAA